MFISESDSPDEKKPNVWVEHSVVEPAAQEVNGDVKKDAKGATAEYKSNPLL
jgi:thioredoxin reductase (NADPH)